MLTLSVTSCKTNVTDGRDPSIVAIYNVYVANAAERGEEVLSYEDWLASIKGEKGDVGEKGDDGLSAYEIYKKYHVAYKGSEEEWINDLASGRLAESYETGYNIVFTLATIPPVLASLDCIANGYDTYAFIERGKTYNGIERIDGFYNLGFNVNDNTSNGFNASDFQLVLDKIIELNVFGNEKFNIYVQDGTALLGAQLAANARLTDKQYKIVMVEDGTGAYNALSSLLTTYDNFVDYSAAVRSQAEEILASSDNEYLSYYDISKAFALSVMDNFEYFLQSESQVENIVRATGDEKLLGVFGFGVAESRLSANLRYGSISELVDALDAAEKEKYLTLMYGDAYAGTYAALTRTTDGDGVAVPDKKLVFIGTRVSGYPAFVTNESVLGMGEISGTVPEYSQLPAKYKTNLLFATEADYNVFYSVISNDDNYPAGISEEVKNAIKADCFNKYANYVATLKFVYMNYGAEYDIIMKGHPRETMDGYSGWNYSVSGTSYSKLMYNAITAFHNGDSVGKRLGLMPYGTAAENLAYLGVDLSIGGLPSSTYTGYETSVDVNFVIAITDGNITGDGNLKSRYEAGNLVYHNSLGEEKITKYFNLGVIYKTLSLSGDEESKAKYTELYNEWIKRVKNVEDASSYEVDDQGFINEK